MFKNVLVETFTNPSYGIRILKRTLANCKCITRKVRALCSRRIISDHNTERRTKIEGSKLNQTLKASKRLQLRFTIYNLPFTEANPNPKFHIRKPITLLIV